MIGRFGEHQWVFIGLGAPLRITEASPSKFSLRARAKKMIMKSLFCFPIFASFFQPTSTSGIPMRSTGLLVPPVALVLLLSCGGGNSSKNTGVPAPTNLHTVLGPGPKNFTLVWTPPAAAIYGYNLEAQENGGSFQQINSGLIPASYTSLDFTFLDSAPEDTTFTFRINAAQGSQTSPYSNTTTANTGLGTPGQPAGHYDWNQSGVSITWSRNSNLSTGFRIERAQSDVYGNPTGAWTALSVTDPLNSSCLDTTVTMGNHYTYRVTNTKGAVSGSASPASSPILTGLPAPNQPAASYDFAKAGMNVTWTKNTTFNDGVKIERIETNSNGTQTGSWTELTPTDPTASTFLDTSVMTNAYYVYRVSNMRNDTTSAASAPSYPAFVGLAAPHYLNAYWSSSKGGVYLNWSAYGIYDAFSIERVTCDASGQLTGTWMTIATPSGTASDYLDLSTQEITNYLFRIAGKRGQITSPAVSSYYLVSTPLAAPTNLTAAVSTGGARLTWQNHSTSATQIVVRRGPAGYTYAHTDVAVLSSTTTSYVDPIARLGNYHYTIVARTDSSETASAPTFFTTPNPPDALALTSSARNFPSAADAALTPTGTWGLATTSPFGMLSNDDPWTPYFPNNNLRNVGNVVQIDALGHPHLVYVILNPQNNQEAILRHTWNDGSTWQTEDMGRTKLLLAFSGVGYDFRLDSTGAPHAILDLGPYGGYSSSIAYVHKVNGAWVQESMGDISPNLYLSAYRLCLDGSDAPHVLVFSAPSVYECARSAQGKWSASVIATPSNSTSGLLDGFWSDGDNALVLYSAYEPYPTTGSDLTAVKKVDGVWQPPSVIGYSNSVPLNVQVAQSPDRARIAMTWADSFGLFALHLDGTGWHPTLLLNPTPDSYSPMYRIGFDSSNKVHILFKNPYPEVGYTDFKE